MLSKTFCHLQYTLGNIQNNGLLYLQYTTGTCRGDQDQGRGGCVSCTPASTFHNPPVASPFSPTERFEAVINASYEQGLHLEKAGFARLQLQTPAISYARLQTKHLSRPAKFKTPCKCCWSVWFSVVTKGRYPKTHLQSLIILGAEAYNEFQFGLYAFYKSYVHANIIVFSCMVKNP